MDIIDSFSHRFFRVSHFFIESDPVRSGKLQYSQPEIDDGLGTDPVPGPSIKREDGSAPHTTGHRMRVFRVPEIN